jgi:hypothetical protein
MGQVGADWKDGAGCRHADPAPERVRYCLGLVEEGFDEGLRIGAINAEGVIGPLAVVIHAEGDDCHNHVGVIYHHRPARITEA